nr:S-layer homology domain-containing protein [Paenibacillus pseudetheri]
MEHVKTFADVQHHWVKNDAEYLGSKLFIHGKTADTFDPNALTTRAELASMLVRGLGLTNAPVKHSFSDAAELSGKWYEETIYQAYEAGMIGGYEDGSVKPDDTITRQEIMAMFTRAVRTAHPDWMKDSTVSSLERFTDGDQVAAWSADSIAAAVQGGLVLGDANEALNPTKVATRAEAAAMLKRLLGVLSQ